MKYLSFLLFLTLILSCNKEDDSQGNSGNTATTPPNILLIIADDMGKDATAGFSEGSIKPNTPNINKIKNEGISFNNMWVYPTCTPTRASIITGKYGYRTGVKWVGNELASSEKTLQKYISEETNNQYATAIIGKWHLSGNNANVNPESFGIDHFAGLIRGGVQDYYNWQLTENGATNLQTDYITEAFTDFSIDWVNSQSKPWFLWLAYNAPHTPFHVPPSEMHSQGNLPEYMDGLDPIPYYMAAIEAMDFQIGRLMAAIPEAELENTIIIFLGDNGTPEQVVQAPFSNMRVKGSLYQGGVNVPMFITGKGVSRTGDDDNLIGSTDLFSTIADLAGVGNPDLNDSQSFTALLDSESPRRAFQYAEKDDGTFNLWTISNGNYKLIENAMGNQEMYDLSVDPYEENNLLDGGLSTQEENAKLELEEELLVIRN